jgi:hypothetical protein
MILARDEKMKIGKRFVRPCYGRNRVKQKTKLVCILVTNLTMGMVEMIRWDCVSVNA